MNRNVQSVANNLPLPKQSNWSFVSSDGSDLAISFPVPVFSFVIAGGRLYVKNNNSPTVWELNFAGYGFGVGIQPIPVPGNFDFSMTQFPCSGVIYTGPQGHNQMTLNDFHGPCLFYQASAQAGIGYGGSFMFMGADWITAAAPPMLRAAIIAARCRAIVRFHGMSVSLIPGAVGAFGAFGVCF